MKSPKIFSEILAIVFPFPSTKHYEFFMNYDIIFKIKSIGGISLERRKIIQVDEKVPVSMLIPLSVQHMFAMFGASILVPTYSALIPPLFF